MKDQGLAKKRLDFEDASQEEASQDEPEAELSTADTAGAAAEAAGGTGARRRTVEPAESVVASLGAMSPETVC